MASKRKLSKENKSLQADVEAMREIVTESAETLKLARAMVAEQAPINDQDLEKLAQEYPQWSISCETAENSEWRATRRKVVKEFRRDMSDLRPELFQDRDTYKRFFDADYFDTGLRDSISIMLPPDNRYVAGRGTFSGGGPGSWFSMTIEGETSLTKLDMMRIEAAEQYLVDEGLFR